MNQSTSPLTHGFFPLSFLSTDYHRLSQIYLISKDIVIITDYYHQFFNLSIFQSFNLHSLWLLICVNLCQSVVYERTGEVETMLLVDSAACAGN